MQRLYWLVGLLFFVTINSAQACWFDAIGVGIGNGKPNDLWGGRLSLQRPLGLDYQSAHGWQFHSYWDLNISEWRTTSTDASANSNRDITIIGLNPVWRITHNPLSNGIMPYAEASVGIAGLSKSTIADRNLGANWAFEDLLGLGMTFGNRQQYDLSLRYLHFSNANIAPPNNGIDVKLLLSLAYHFA